jgi:hypothetical protein
MTSIQIYRNNVMLLRGRMCRDTMKATDSVTIRATGTDTRDALDSFGF